MAETTRNTHQWGMDGGNHDVWLPHTQKIGGRRVGRCSVFPSEKRPKKRGDSYLAKNTFFYDIFGPLKSLLDSNLCEYVC